jgi:hypothetical protein
MTTPYSISRSLGSQTFQGYVNAPIMGPLNSNNYPFSMQYHNYGLLVGKNVTPPQFYPGQEPVYSDMNVNAKQQYIRTNSITPMDKLKQDTLGKLSKPMTKVSYSSQRHYPVSTHMNYIQPIGGSMYVDRKKSIAVGKSSYSENTPIGTKSFDTSYRRSALRRARSGGSTAPKKKGSIYNYSLTQPGINGWGSLPRQNY